MIVFAFPVCSRTDDYIACTESVGVKLRQQRTLEVKVRATVATCGAEFWSKVDRCSVDTSKDLQDLVSSKLLHLSTISKQYRPPLEDAWKEMQDVTGGLTVVSLRKRRKCGYVKRVAVEQTDIEVISCNGVQKQGMSEPKTGTGHQVKGDTVAVQLAQPCSVKWRSVSFEEGVGDPSRQQPSNIEALLESLGAGKADPLPPLYKQAGAKVMGYPQFVLEVKCSTNK